mmetsp:Transcript_37622/g.72104  ORF Transcript_37622/g.72104 Transcript_37622/m.72104 type:complete len:253 (+) Transcript_37622:583-1341(+)
MRRQSDAHILSHPLVTILGQVECLDNRAVNNHLHYGNLIVISVTPESLFVNHLYIPTHEAPQVRLSVHSRAMVVVKRQIVCAGKSCPACVVVPRTGDGACLVRRPRRGRDRLHSRDSRGRERGDPVRRRARGRSQDGGGRWRSRRRRVRRALSERGYGWVKELVVPDFVPQPTSKLRHATCLGAAFLHWHARAGRCRRTLCHHGLRGLHLRRVGFEKLQQPHEVVRVWHPSEGAVPVVAEMHAGAGGVDGVR